MIKESINEKSLNCNCRCVKTNGLENEPFVLDVLVDACGNENGDDGVVPAGNEHERKTQADAEH